MSEAARIPELSAEERTASALERIADALEKLTGDAKPASPKRLERKPPARRRLSAEQIERVAEQTLARAGRLRR